MANKGTYTHYYDDLPKIAKIIIQAIVGSIVGGAYRIVRYVETKNTVTLVAGILALIPPISVAAWVIDLITMITKDEINILAD